MKYIKALMIVFLAVILVGIIVFTANEAMAKVGSHKAAVCSICHTMHHSQDGTNPKIGFQTGTYSTGPNDALLYGIGSGNNKTCVACHSGNAANASGYDADTGAPQVDLAGAAMLAGGSYDGWTGSSAAADARMHNVLGLCSADTVIEGASADVPPGGLAEDIGSAAQITCAGVNGCHGDRSQSTDTLAVHGAHHTDDSGTLTGTTVGLSYRFLSTDSATTVFGSASGVKGMENSIWESGLKNSFSDTRTANADTHNVYEAADINAVCASCHPDFHGTGTGDGGQGSPEPWLRHPTDITLSSAGSQGPSNEYLDYPGEADNYEYSLEAPVGFDDDQLAFDETAALEGQVLCISCHRAHGSEYADILRWCYADMRATAGTGTIETGCNRCHTTK